MYLVKNSTINVFIGELTSYFIRIVYTEESVPQQYCLLLRKKLKSNLVLVSFNNMQCQNRGSNVAF